MLLQQPQHHSHPFSYFTCADALPEALLERLCGLYAQPLVWQHHTDSFYRAYLSDVSEHLDAGFCASLSARMASLLGMPLTARIRATLQRMEPGQYALPHTDRPLVGYEAARLVVQLNPSWSPSDGGLLGIHPDAQGAQTVVCHAPGWNTAFGFAMGPRSFHSVQEVRSTRRTLVLNFWHAANTEALAAWVAAQLEGMRFDFDGELARLASDAEPRVSEEDSLRAGCVAHLLLRWGFAEAVVCEGYRAGLRDLTGREGEGAVLLARWVARLWLEEFDARLWAKVAPGLMGWEDARVQEGLELVRDSRTANLKLL